MFMFACLFSAIVCFGHEHPITRPVYSHFANNQGITPLLKLQSLIISLLSCLTPFRIANLPFVFMRLPLLNGHFFNFLFEDPN